MELYQKEIKDTCTMFYNVTQSSIYIYSEIDMQIIYSSKKELTYDHELHHLMQNISKTTTQPDPQKHHHSVDFYQFDKSVFCSAFYIQGLWILQFGVHKVDIDHQNATQFHKNKPMRPYTHEMYKNEPESLSALTSHVKLLYTLLYPDSQTYLLNFNYKIISHYTPSRRKKQKDAIHLQQNRLYKFISFDLYAELKKGIASGNISEIESLVNTFNLSEWNLQLTKNALRTMKYHAIITATYCSNILVENHISYDLALDFLFKFIKAIDQTRTIFDVIHLIKEIPLESAIWVKEVRLEGKKSKSCKIMMEYLKENFNKDVTVGDLVQLTQLDPSYISRLIKKETGRSFKTLLHGYRIERAKELLLMKNMSILEISMLCGFKSQSHFARVFKSQTGIQPSQYGFFNF